MSDNTQLIRAIADAAANATAAARSASAAAGNASKAALAAQGSAGSATAAVAAAAAAAASAASVTDIATVTPTANKIPIAGPSGKLDAGWIDGGGGNPPVSVIDGLDFHDVAGTPTLRETPAEVAAFVHGMDIGRKSDDSNPLIQVYPGVVEIDLGPNDQFFVESTTGNAQVGIDGSSDELVLFGDTIWMGANGTGIVHIGSGNGDTIDVGAAEDVVYISGDSISIGAPGVNIGTGTGESVNLVNNYNDSLNVGENSSGGFDPLLRVFEGFVMLRLGSTDTFIAGTVDNETFLQISESSTLFRNADGGTFEVQSDNVSIHGNGSGNILFGGMGDTVDIEGSHIVVYGYKIYSPVKGSDVSVSGSDVTLAPGTDGASEYVVDLGSTNSLQLLNDGPPMDGQLVRLILPATNGFVLTILDATSTTLFAFPISIPNGNAAAATFRYTVSGWIFCGSEFVDNR